jgi:hypothetical protein
VLISCTDGGGHGGERIMRGSPSHELDPLFNSNTEQDGRTVLLLTWPPKVTPAPSVGAV